VCSPFKPDRGKKTSNMGDPYIYIYIEIYDGSAIYMCIYIYIYIYVYITTLFAMSSIARSSCRALWGQSLRAKDGRSIGLGKFLEKAGGSLQEHFCDKLVDT